MGGVTEISDNVLFYSNRKCFNFFQKWWKTRGREEIISVFFLIKKRNFIKWFIPVNYPIYTRKIHAF